MTERELEMVLKVGENIRVEFKRANGGPKDDTYETVCAFLNRFGGDIYLGVEDSGAVMGLPKSMVADIIKNIIKVTANSELLNPPFCVYAEAMEYQGKDIVRIHVPQSSDIHRYRGVCYDRSFESDVKVTSVELLRDMMVRKRGAYIERTLFPGVKARDLKLELLENVYSCISIKYPRHPWLKLKGTRFLTAAGLYEENEETGKMCFNGAAVLLFGKEETLFDYFPHYKTDALLRRVNKERYDDRDTVCCNLIEAYDRLMDFGAKHLPDKFYLEGTARASLRDLILREAVVNSLMHREYSSAFQSRMVIEEGRMLFDNPSRASRCCQITLENLSPVSKNPLIARLFKQMGWADELGSGTLNLYRYCKLYSNATPVLMEGDTFVTTIPLDGDYSFDVLTREPPASPKSCAGSRKKGDSPVCDAGESYRTKKLLRNISRRPGSRTDELAKAMGCSQSSVSRELKKLKEEGRLEFRGAKKNGGYYLK